MSYEHNDNYSVVFSGRPSACKRFIAEHPEMELRFCLNYDGHWEVRKYYKS